MSFFNSLFRSENTIENKVDKIQKGDEILREILIQEYVPFIVKTVSQKLGRYVSIENNEEFSVGLSAFNEAINSFDIKKGNKFLIYSKKVINSRLIDYYRSNKKNRDIKVYPFTYFEDEKFNALEKRYMMDNAGELEKIETADEISYFKLRLREYGINFDDLVLYSPRHKDSIRQCVKIARMITDDDRLYDMMTKRKAIPLNELMKITDVHRRTVERNRKFIITTCLIIKSDLDVLKAYVVNAEEGGTLNA